MDKISLSHHAYCLSGDRTHIIDIRKALENDHNIELHGNPDYFEREYDIFSIDNARELITIHATMPVLEAGKKIFVISSNGITVEAQNALLKLLEEPAPYAHFFIILPSTHLLLPTVRSRMRPIETKRHVEDTRNIAAKEFLKLSLPKRLEMLKSLLEDIAEDNKVKQDAVIFLDALEREVYTEIGVKKGGEMLEAIALARKYIHDRSPSLKMLLEYVALKL